MIEELISKINNSAQTIKETKEVGEQKWSSNTDEIEKFEKLKEQGVKTEEGFEK